MHLTTVQYLAIIFLNVNNNNNNKKQIMRFREFEAKIKELHAFNLNDVRKLDPDFIDNDQVTGRTRGTSNPWLGVI